MIVPIVQSDSVLYIYNYYCNVHTITYIILCIVILLIVHGNHMNDSFFFAVFKYLIHRIVP